MPTWKSFAEFGVDLQRMAKDLTRDEKGDVTRQMGVAGQRIAGKHFAHDLGPDRAFSGWRRSSPIPANTKLISRPDGVTLLTPSNRGAAGVITTVTGGRHNDHSPTTVFLGPGVNPDTGETARTKSGRVRKVRTRKQRRWNGRTAGKRTAERAVAEMERALPKVADKAVRKVIAKRFDVT